jgi:hypothetical protein
LERTPHAVRSEFREVRDVVHILVEDVLGRSAIEADHHYAAAARAVRRFLLLQAVKKTH